MHYLVAGLAKSGTTALFTSLRDALPADTETFFEPRTEAEFLRILSRGEHGHTLTKALIGHVTSDHEFVRRFWPNVLIVRDPRDQMVSELVYRFYDFTLRHDPVGYAEGRALLERKVKEPAAISTVELFNRLGALVGRPGVELLDRKYGWVVGYRNAFRPHMVHYESFVDGDVGELERYLGFKVAVRPEVDDEFARVARTMSHGEWRAWFTEEDLAFVNAHVGGLMEELGYQVERVAALPEELPSSTTLEYIEQFRP